MEWTEARVDQLKNLWEEGLSASQIANRLGDVTRNAVIERLTASDSPLDHRRSNALTIP